MVVAEDRHQALDAAEAVEVTYDEKPANTITAKALDPDTPLVHPAFGTNEVLVTEHGLKEETEAALAAAHHVTELVVPSNRNHRRFDGAPLLPRSLRPGQRPLHRVDHQPGAAHRAPLLHQVAAHSRAQAQGDRARRRRRLRHEALPLSRRGAGALGCHRLRPARALGGHPLRMPAGRHPREGPPHRGPHGLRCGRQDPRRSGSRRWPPSAPTRASGRRASPTGYHFSMLSCAYDIPAIHTTVRAVYTNATPVDAYRGAGRPEAVYQVERMIENGAQEMGIDPLELRARNLIPPEKFPYRTAIGITYDSGDPPALVEKAKALSDYDALRAEQAALRAEGKWMGIGICAFFDMAGAGPVKMMNDLGARIGCYDVASVRVAPRRAHHRVCRQSQPRAGPRDHLEPDRRRSPRLRHRAYRRGGGRYRPRAHGHRHLGLALAVDRRHGDLHRRRPSRGQGQADGGAHDGVRARGPRPRRRRVHGKGHRPQALVRSRRQRLLPLRRPPARPGDRPRGDLVLRPPPTALTPRRCTSASCWSTPRPAP